VRKKKKQPLVLLCTRLLPMTACSKNTVSILNKVRHSGLFQYYKLQLGMQGIGYPVGSSAREVTVSVTAKRLNSGLWKTKEGKNLRSKVPREIMVQPSTKLHRAPPSGGSHPLPEKRRKKSRRANPAPEIREGTKGLNFLVTIRLNKYRYTSGTTEGHFQNLPLKCHNYQPLGRWKEKGVPLQ